MYCKGNDVAPLFRTLTNLPYHKVKDINTFELIGNNQNTSFGILDASLNEWVEGLNEALPRTAVKTERKISHQTLSTAEGGLTLRVFYAIGIRFADKSGFDLAPFGTENIELVGLQIAKSKRGLLIDDYMMELILIFCQKYLQRIPLIKVSMTKEGANPKSLKFFKKHGFKEKKQADDGLLIMMRDEEQFY